MGGKDGSPQCIMEQVKKNHSLDLKRFSIFFSKLKMAFENKQKDICDPFLSQN